MYTYMYIYIKYENYKENMLVEVYSAWIRSLGFESPSGRDIFCLKKLWHFHKNTRSCDEYKCCCPRTVDILNVNFT